MKAFYVSNCNIYANFNPLWLDFNMKNSVKNVLLISSTSDMATFLKEKLSLDGVNIYATNRKNINSKEGNINNYHLDVTNEDDINNLFNNFKDLKFDAVVNFQGIAISSPVEFLSSDELKKQFDVSIFSLLNILRNLRGKMNKNGVIINVSSMSSYGIYPFLSPYCMAKSAADILLSAYEMETNIKTVSIKPGVVKTKFWDSSINENKENFKKYCEEYENIGKFLEKNAKNNSNKGINPEDVSKLIYKIIYDKSPKQSYLIGKDAYFTAFISNFKGRILSKLIRWFLNLRVKRSINES